MLISLVATLGLGAGMGPLPSPTAGRKLVFSYDFAHRKLSTKDWTYNNGPVYNDEKEKYTSNNTFYKGGTLVIEGRKEGKGYTSARLQSVKAWKYVYVESIARVPAGRGTWPAIWMLNDRLRHNGKADHVDWPKCGEIDIMENVGYDPPNFHFSLHSEQYNFMHASQRTEITKVSNPGDYHKFGMDWRPDRITFYLDDKPVYDVKKTEDTIDSWPFRDPFYIILNLAIGGTWGGAKGIDESIFPTKFEIKTVKVYQ